MKQHPETSKTHEQIKDNIIQACYSYLNSFTFTKKMNFKLANRIEKFLNLLYQTDTMIYKDSDEFKKTLLNDLLAAVYSQQLDSSFKAKLEIAAPSTDLKPTADALLTKNIDRFLVNDEESLESCFDSIQEKYNTSHISNVALPTDSRFDP